MSKILSLEDVSLAYGLAPLLDHAHLQISAGERVCLIGRNGAGKSSLLKIIEGHLSPDAGTVWRQPHLRLARLEQTLPDNPAMTVYEFIAEGLAKTGTLLSEYHSLTQQMATAHTATDLKKLETLQREIDAIDGWHFENEMNTITTKLALNPDAKLSDLSGGWQRRAALAKALVTSPELLLLDEPTNHLDIDAISWLEEFLRSTNITLVFITHDRALLQRLATRIIELDRGQLTSWPGDYQNFLRRKAEMLHAEAKEHAEFDKKLAQEEKWIRQGIKARRTRNEGRVRELEAMREQRSKRRETEGTVSFNVAESDKSGKLVIEATHISHQFADIDIIRDFSIRIQRGDRIGLIGPNGAGKSTLLNILLGKLTPSHGNVTIGTKLDIAYFDQRRDMLDLEKTALDNIAEGSDMIEINGKQKHVISYLGDFLFSPERARTCVKTFSGGECNRLLLARLFSRPSNLLILDEPTNDLDIETLELLEELISQYQGTLLIVSHDRQFLDNVVTSTLVFTGNGHIQEYVGGYQDYLQQRKPIVTAKKAASKNLTDKKPKAKTKLSYKEQQELKTLPTTIEKLEADISAQQTAIADPDFYNQPPDVIAKEMEKLNKLNDSLDAAFSRWATLEEEENKYK